LNFQNRFLFLPKLNKKMTSPKFKIPYSRVNRLSYLLLMITCWTASAIMIAMLIYVLFTESPHKLVLIIFLLFSAALFGGIAVFINSFSKTYIAGIYVYSDKISIFYPQKKKYERFYDVSFITIEKLKFSSFIEIQRYKSMEKKTLVLKLEILYTDIPTKELKKIDVFNTEKNKEKFFQLPDFLIANNYVEKSKIEIQK